MLTNVNGNELMSHQGWIDGIYRETKQKKNREFGKSGNTCV